MKLMNDGSNVNNGSSSNQQQYTNAADSGIAASSVGGGDSNVFAMETNNNNRSSVKSSSSNKVKPQIIPPAASAAAAAYNSARRLSKSKSSPNGFGLSLASVPGAVTPTPSENVSPATTPGAAGVRPHNSSSSSHHHHTHRQAGMPPRDKSYSSAPSRERLSAFDQATKELSSDRKTLKEITLGRRVGFYRIRGELGSGNFSQVKLAVHTLTKERVAIKIIDKSKLDQKTQKLLSHEISNMEILHHPHIIRLYEVVETLAKVYLVMEFAGGGELYAKICNEGKFPEPQARPVFAQILSAVIHIHAKGIVHRDLKAENVLYSGPGVVKVGDFCFSNKLPAQGGTLGTFCGSPPYAAPELFKNKHYDGKPVDQWALGVLLYFMCSSSLPFRGDTLGKLKNCILEGDFIVPSYLSPELSSLLQRILVQDPTARPSCEEIARDEWMQDEPLPLPLKEFRLNPEEVFVSKRQRAAQSASTASSYTTTPMRTLPQIPPPPPTPTPATTIETTAAVAVGDAESAAVAAVADDSPNNNTDAGSGVAPEVASNIIAAATPVTAQSDATGGVPSHVPTEVMVKSLSPPPPLPAPLSVPPVLVPLIAPKRISDTDVDKIEVLDEIGEAVLKTHNKSHHHSVPLTTTSIAVQSAPSSSTPPTLPPPRLESQFSSGSAPRPTVEIGDGADDIDSAAIVEDPFAEEDENEISSQLNAEEREARRILHELGITAQVILQAKGKQSRSSITGTYRIILHRLQRQALGIYFGQEAGQIQPDGSVIGGGAPSANSSTIGMSFAAGGGRHTSGASPPLSSAATTTMGGGGVDGGGKSSNKFMQRLARFSRSAKTVSANMMNNNNSSTKSTPTNHGNNNSAVPSRALHSAAARPYSTSGAGGGSPAGQVLVQNELPSTTKVQSYAGKSSNNNSKKSPQFKFRNTVVGPTTKSNTCSIL